MKVCRLAFATCLVGALLGCGGSDSGTKPTVTPTPVPTPPPPMVIREGGFNLPFDENIIITGRVEFATTSTGTLNISADWTFATNSIEVIVTRGACSYDQLNANQCDLVSLTRGTAPKPRRVSLSGQPAGTYTLFIGNLGPGDESVSYQIVLNAVAGAASGGAARHQATLLDYPGVRAPARARSEQSGSER